MKTYDYIIIGAGSAGCNTAYFLNASGASVAIIDKEGICGSASGAAGAFLSPLPGKKNLYNSFVNDALNFSIDFYESLQGIHIEKKGVLRVVNENFEKNKLNNNDITHKHYTTQKLKSISKNFQNIDGYFYENAAIIEPLETSKILLDGCDFYQKDIKELLHVDGYYTFEDIRAKNIILAQGVNTHLVDIPYITISPIFGLRVDVKTSTEIPFNIHKSISVSTNKQNSTVSIGATQQRHDSAEMSCDTTCDKCAFYVNTDEAQINTLLSQADELIQLDDLEVTKVYKGARASIKSYFPVIGKIINFKGSLQEHPSIKKGTKIPKEKLSYFPNMHIINALGSRGFVFGPYLAKLLTDSILKDKEIPLELSTEKLFYKVARKV